MEAEKYSDAGTDRISKNGHLLGGVYESTIWNKSLSGDKLDAEEILFEDFISAKNSELADRLNFLTEVRKTGGSIEYFVGWFSSGSINMNIVLDPELMRTTSSLGISLIICAYPESE